MAEENGSEFKPRDYFSAENARPSKSLGQNFITDKRVIERIVSAAGITPDDEVLEIGPGLGALTFALACKAARVVAVEKDARLAERLRALLPEWPNVELVCADALDVDFGALYKGRRLKVAANLPYSVSSPILIRLLRDRALFSTLVLMLQLEVGERISSPPGGKEYGSLSVLVQTYFDVKLLFRVSPSSFWPAPRVDSVVLKLTPLPEPRVPVADEAAYERILRAAFSSRRKMLGNSLGSALRKGAADRILAAAGIDRTRRAETLSVEEFGAICREAVKSGELA
ncbi:MAG TPA: 16S rRNA (adenine(1518)-N(6)/adenine(1519)-N(6))-dimethyltransferase RsmA [Thermodesulfobacteriota bacterium]|nr:16S rRNA (adenine(1518)-N(6)/adenine(1519)-N(6))-dimethyltransferase RsmA [Thermodesulfobacteriota bacterium]